MTPEARAEIVAARIKDQHWWKRFVVLSREREALVGAKIKSGLWHPYAGRSRRES